MPQGLPSVQEFALDHAGGAGSVLARGRRALGAGLAAVALLLAAVYVALPWGEGCRACYYDLWIYLSAAHALRAGQNPYDQDAIVAHWVGTIWFAPSSYWNGYPPYFLVALQPLTWVPPRVAERAWTVLNLGGLVGLSLLLLRLARLPLSPARLGLVLLVTLGYLPTLAVLNLGQVTILLAATGYLAWWLLQRGRPGAAGLALALLTIKPHWLVTPLLYLAVRREWRALGAFGLGALALLLPGWPLLAAWYGAMQGMAAYHQAHRTWANPSPLNLMAYLGLGAPEVRLVIAGVLSAALLSGFALLAWRAVGKPGEPLTPREDLVFALGWVLLPLVLPQFRAYDLMVVLGPLLLVGWTHWRRKDLTGRAGLALVALAWGWPSVQLLTGRLGLGLSNEWVWYLVSPVALFLAGLLGPAARQFSAAGVSDQAEAE